MSDSLDVWHKTLSPILAGIRHNAMWVTHHAKEVLDKTRMLPLIPDFETEAQGEIDAALDMLEAAQRKLCEAKLVYSGKPVEGREQLVGEKGD